MSYPIFCCRRSPSVEVGPKGKEEKERLVPMEEGTSAAEEVVDPIEKIDLTKDTYNFPLAIQLGGGNGLTQIMAFVFITCPTFLLQSYLLAIAVDDNLFKSASHTPWHVFYFQFGAVLIVMLSLGDDLSTVWSILSAAEFSLIGVIVAYLQSLAMAWTLFTSAVFISEQKSRIDVVFGAFTLTFINTLDQSIMIGLMAFGSIFRRTANFRMRIQEQNRVVWTLAVQRRERKETPEIVEQETISARFSNFCWIGRSISAPIIVCLILLWVPYDLVSHQETSSPFKLEVGGCTGKTESGSNWTTISAHKTCVAAAESLGLSHDAPRGEGLCVWRAASSFLQMAAPASSELDHIEHMCQPTHVLLMGIAPAPSMYQWIRKWYGLIGKPPRRVCAINSMEEITDEDECAMAASSLYATPPTLTSSLENHLRFGSRSPLFEPTGDIVFSKHDPPTPYCRRKVGVYCKFA